MTDDRSIPTLPAGLRSLVEQLKALKRYRVHVQRADPDDPLSAVQYVACPPDPSGGWVRWSDVATLLAASPGETPQDVEFDPEFHMACDGCGSVGHQDADGWAMPITNGPVFCGRCAQVVAVFQSALRSGVHPQEDRAHKHDFAYYEVCRVCGKTDAACAGCHHCTDSDSVKNGRCWWCLQPVAQEDRAAEKKEEGHV